MAQYTIGRQEQVRIPDAYGGGFVDAMRVWFTSQPSGTVARVDIPLTDYPQQVAAVVSAFICFALSAAPFRDFSRAA